MRRHIVTGAPGSGKTSIIDALAAHGYDVVPEAATAIIVEQQELGVAEPWTRPEFIDQITHRQSRQSSTAIGDEQIFDRSPVCTLALQRLLGHPESTVLRGELDRIRDERVFARDVFLVRPLGFIEATAARRISYPESLEFERVHIEAYQELSYNLIDIPPAPLDERVDLVRRYLSYR